MTPSKLPLSSRKSLAILFVVGISLLALLLSRANNDVWPGQTMPIPPISEPAADRPGLELYRNEKYGFEFWYPANWEWRENIFGGQSKFNLTAFEIDGKRVSQDNYLSVVSNDWAKSVAQKLDIPGAAKSSRVVDGVTVTEYRYTFKTVPTVSIDIPLGEFTLFVVFDETYAAELEQILSSFTLIPKK